MEEIRRRLIEVANVNREGLEHEELVAISDASALIAELEREIEKWKIAYDAVMESNDDKDDAIRDLNALLSSSRAEEREACAKIVIEAAADDDSKVADDAGDAYNSGSAHRPVNERLKSFCAVVASAIRARATKE